MPAKPIVFLPGYPASELWRVTPRRMIFPFGLDDIATPNKRAELSALLCDTGPTNRLVAGQPIRRVLLIAKQAESLYDILRRFGYTIESGDNFRAVGWDWRLSIDHAKVQGDIRAAITELRAATGQKPVVVLHSTGGLVFRQLLETDPTLRTEIEQILAFGVPWAGNLKALRYLTKGEAIGFLTARLNATQVRSIMRCAQAAYDLCPPDPQRTGMTSPDGRAFRLVVDGNGRAIAPLLTSSWMPATDPAVQQRARDADARFGARTPSLATTVPVTNVCGWGIQTETQCTIDGADVSFASTDEGDGTAAYVSASWIRDINVRTLPLAVGVTVTDQIPDRHAQLWSSEPVQQILKEVLEDVPRGPFVHAAVDNDESLDPNSDVTIRIVATTPVGAPLPNTRVTLHLAANNERTTAMPETRLRMKLSRGNGLQANFGSRFFRFRVDVKWDGGSKEIPLMVRI